MAFSGELRTEATGDVARRAGLLVAADVGGVADVVEHVARDEDEDADEGDGGPEGGVGEEGEESGEGEGNDDGDNAEGEDEEEWLGVVCGTINGEGDGRVLADKVGDGVGLL